MSECSFTPGHGSVKLAFAVTTIIFTGIFSSSISSGQYVLHINNQFKSFLFYLNDAVKMCAGITF